MKPMNAQAQLAHSALVGRVETALRLLTVQAEQDDESLEVARARLADWLEENRDRWVL